VDDDSISGGDLLIRPVRDIDYSSAADVVVIG
jgi:hypothetical protein